MLAMMASHLAHVALRLDKVALRLPKVALKPPKVALKLPKVALKLAQVALPLADKARSSFRLAHRKPPRNHASVGSKVAGASIIGISKNSAESGAVTVSFQNQVVPGPTILFMLDKKDDTNTPDTNNAEVTRRAREFHPL